MRHDCRGVCDDLVVDVRAEALRLVVAMLVLVGGLTAVRVFRYDGYTVQGVNMAPTLESGDDLLVRHDGAVSPGEVVIATIPGGSKVLSRVVAVGGDVVVFADGGVVRNGVRLSEDYLAPGTVTEPPGDGTTRVVVRPGTVYLLGDNRGVSTDSRDYGAVPLEGIVGSVVDVWWWPGG
jgi:signal peptidase I